MNRRRFLKYAGAAAIAGASALGLGHVNGALEAPLPSDLQLVISPQLLNPRAGYDTTTAGRSIDIVLGFSPLIIVVVFQVGSALLALYPLRKIMKRYRALLGREFSKQEIWATRLLCFAFMVYWLVLPWDLSPLFH